MHEPSGEDAPGHGHRGGLVGLLLGSRESISGTVYGTVIVMATIAAGSKGGLQANVLLATMVTTVLVLWIAHVYAGGLEASIQAGRRLDWPEFADVARHEWSIALAAIPPGIPLLLGSLHVLESATAAWLALAAGVVVLAAQGIRYARLERLTPLATVFSVSLNVGLGLTIVLLKVIVTH